MKRIFVWLLFSTVLLLAGCERLLAPSDAPKVRTVSQIVISIDSGTERHQVLYKDPRKVTKVLNYLRRMETWNLKEQDPLPQESPRYSIDLHLSDGTRKNYEQIRYDSFKEEQMPWMKIGWEYALQLPLILAAVPSDAI